jgi:hypothetical protein
MTLIKSFLITGFLLSFLNSCQNAEKVDFIFDNDFKGWAIIIFNSNKGIEETKDKGRVKLKIPSNGILFTKSKRPEGILDNRYYIKDDNGDKIKIYSSIEEIPHKDSLTPYVLVESYQSLKFKTVTEDWLNFDNVIIFKITKGFNDTTASKLEIDTYISSIKQNLIQATH